MRRTLATLTMILGLVLSQGAAIAAQPAQNAQTFTSATTGIEFDLGSSGAITFLPGDYEIRDTPPVLGEYVWFTYNGSNFQVLLIGGDNDTLSSHDATMGNMIDGYDSWTLIAEEMDVDYSWFIGEAELNGETIIVLYSFELDAFGETDLMVMQFAVPETLQRDLEFVQGEVTIGGNAFLPHISAEAVAVVAGVDLASDQQASSSTQAQPGSWESLGLVSESEWHSPTYGTRIFWDVTVWEFPFDFDGAIVIEGDPPFDTIGLQLIDGTGYAFVSVDTQFDDDTPDGMIEIWTSDDYLDNVLNGATLRASVLTPTSAMIVYETTIASGEVRVVLQEATYLQNGTVLISRLWGTPNTIDLVYGEFILGIHIDGEPFQPAWTVEDLGALFGF